MPAAVDLAGVCTGPGPCDTTPIGAGKNWVTAVGGLPVYIRAIAKALIRSGHPESDAIKLAVGTVKRWAAGGGNVTGPTRARAVKALAEWEAKKAATDLSNADAYDRQRNALPGAEPWVPTPQDTADNARMRSNRAKVGSAARGRDPVMLRRKAAEHAKKAETARKAGDQATYAHHAGIAMGLLDAAQAADGLPPGIHLSNGEPMTAPVTDGMHVYDPKGDELDEAKRTVRAVSALKKRGSTKQAQSLQASFVKAKTSRARKMPDGKVRAHTAVEVNAGLDRLASATNLSGGTTMTTVDLAGTTRFLPDAAAVKKAAAKLGKLPPPLRKNLAARIAKRAKELGITVSLANDVRKAIDLSVDQATRDAARKAGLTFPGTTSYPLAGPDGKFSRSLAQKAVRMVGLGNVASHAKIRSWLVGKLKANHAADLIPATWPEAKG